MYGNAWKYTTNIYLGMRFLFLHEGKSEDTIKSPVSLKNMNSIEN